jgi:hypothetical protein
MRVTIINVTNNTKPIIERTKEAELIFFFLFFLASINTHPKGKNYSIFKILFFGKEYPKSI